MSFNVTFPIAYSVGLFALVVIAWLAYGELKDLRADLTELLKLERARDERAKVAAARARVG